MFLLDTDHITFLHRKMGTEYACIAKRMAQYPTAAFYWSIVSMHEQLLGAHNLILQTKKKQRLLRGYELLEQIRREYGKQQTLGYDQAADTCYDSLKKSGVQIGTRDLRIAAIALSRKLTVLTRNSSDFSQVPGLQIDDWTK